MGALDGIFETRRPLCRKKNGKFRKVKIALEGRSGKRTQLDRV
jgi:hypothetical protein